LILGHVAIDLHQRVAFDVDVGGEDASELLIVFAYKIQGLPGREREDAPAGPLLRRVW
jgi:hypothetical protein